MQTYKTVLNTEIRRDETNKISLNDLHKASGRQERHSPWRWAKTEQAISLCAWLADSSPSPSLVSSPAGTWADEALVPAYALWIGAAFYLKVVGTPQNVPGTRNRQADYNFAKQACQQYIDSLPDRLKTSALLGPVGAVFSL